MSDLGQPISPSSLAAQMGQGFRLHKLGQRIIDTTVQFYQHAVGPRQLRRTQRLP